MLFRSDPDVFYYVTLYNENQPMPPMPEGVTAHDVVRGLYRWAEMPQGHSRHATVLFSGTANSAARAAATELAERYGIAVDLWSATSYKALREDALSAERWNRLHPGAARRVPVVAQLLGGSSSPVVAVTDFMKVVPEIGRAHV